MTAINLAQPPQIKLPSFCLIPTGERPRANTWVKLLELPHPWSYDEALLLCQHSESEWVAWIPDFGETILNVNCFC